MFTEERLNEILNILKLDGKVKVKDLSTKFNVTEDCIRKDLKQLENNGKLKRTYGGAIPVREHNKVIDISERGKIDIASKTIIAKKALNLIENKDTIFLDISTINVLTAQLLLSSHKEITVVTNMLEIINTLSTSNSNITLVAVSGVLNKNLHGFTNSSAIDLINRYIFDKSFVGSCGIDINLKTVSTFDIDDGYTKNAIIKSSKKSFLVMENRKFNTDGNYKFSSLEDIDGIITNIPPDTETIDVLSQYNVNLY